MALRFAASFFGDALALKSTIAGMGGAVLLLPGIVFDNGPGWHLVRLWVNGDETLLAGICFSLWIAPGIAALVQSIELRLFCHGLHGLFWTAIAVSFLTGQLLGFGSVTFVALAVWSWGSFVTHLLLQGAEAE